MSELQLHLRNVGAQARPISLMVDTLVIAGWTGRNQAAVEAHIRELGEMGIPPPRTAPIFYRVSASLLTLEPEIQVIGGDSTGEVEFVVFQTSQGLLVGLGSDHTDRKVEAMGVTLSKQMCPKPIAAELWDFAEVAPHWDELILRSFAVNGNDATLYQEGGVSAMRHPLELIDRYGQASQRAWQTGMAMYGGTFGVIGGLRWASEFAIELEDPVLNRKITHRYRIAALPIEG